jgi:hypothetical protein
MEWQTLLRTDFKPEVTVFDPRVTALARPRSNCTSKLQTYPLVREDAPHQETRNRQRENKNLAMGSRWEPDTKTD